MKRIKIASILFAIALIALSSFTRLHNHKVHSAGFYRWFEYDGYGDPFDPESYRILAFESECTSSDPILCSVYAEVDFWSWRPTISSLNELAISSNYFTQMYSGGFGEVRLEDY